VDPPDLRTIQPGQLSRCHFADELELAGVSLI
jgi:hypothetical protein